MNARIIPLIPDQGTAYGRPAPSHKKELTEVGPGTPMGELLRRYWHPIGLAADATDTPRQVRVLGEDLILFRDKQGRAGDGKSILTAIEMEMIRRAMEETRGNQLRSAMILGINRSTLKKRLLEMREAGIKVFT